MAQWLWRHSAFCNGPIRSCVLGPPSNVSKRLTRYRLLAYQTGTQASRLRPRHDAAFSGGSLSFLP
jgi:hypothetical protein